MSEKLEPTLDEYGLAPCPFCGNPFSDGGVYPANREETEWQVACGNVEGCGAHIHGHSHAGVKANWNRRAHLKSSAPDASGALRLPLHYDRPSGVIEDADGTAIAVVCKHSENMERAYAIVSRCNRVDEGGEQL